MYIQTVIAIAGLGLLLVATLGTQREIKAQEPFARELNQFQASDRKNPPAPGQILFIGSSSFTRWTDVGDYFPSHKILNRAFGGSTLLDQIKYVKQVVYPYRPMQIVIYCGENDFGNDAKLAAYEATNRFITLFALIRNRFKDVPIIYVSMKPSPSRWLMRRKFIAANRWIEEFCKHQRDATFVNVWDVMLTEQGRPKPEIYVADRLHMNAEGYHLWQPLIERALLP